MSIITGNINLTALKHQLITTPKGNKALVIPIALNNLFLSEKDNVYINIVAFPIDKAKRGDRKDTHIVSQSFDKEKREEMKASGIESPILGNLTDWDMLPAQEPEPNRFSQQPAQEDLPNDLPF